jgi:hypothetical protein
MPHDHRKAGILMNNSNDTGHYEEKNGSSYFNSNSFTPTMTNEAICEGIGTNNSNTRKVDFSAHSTHNYLKYPNYQVSSIEGTHNDWITKTGNKYLGTDTLLKNNQIQYGSHNSGAILGQNRNDESVENT